MGLMRVYLINPPRIHPKTWGLPGVFQPIDLAYVGAVLERQGHEVKILDAAAEGWRTVRDLDDERYIEGLSCEEIAARLESWLPNIVGINVPFSGWSNVAFMVASIAKSINKDVFVVMDGVHPSARPIKCLENPNVDYVIIGEPEITWAELTSALEHSSDRLDAINGLGFKQSGKIIINKERSLIKNLDDLPFPARHLLPMSLYFEAVRENPLRGEVSKPWTVMYTSRGCPYKCIFCSAHLVRGRVWRGRSPDNVIEEIRLLVDSYKIKQIDFCDDNMAIDQVRMEKICDKIIENKFDIEWFTPNGLRADTLNEKLLKKMADAGCKRIYVAPESDNQRVGFKAG
jgi:magnesium-protoporphyrin IX monomethyl ester (oxidative) cyclase